MKRISHEQFLLNIYDRNEHIRSGEIILQGEYTGIKDGYILIDKYGFEHTINGKNLYTNSGPTIKSVIDKTGYIKRKFTETHGDKYTYDKVEYSGYENKVIVTCPIHGDFSADAHGHISGHGCPKCGVESNRIKRVKSKDEFVSQALLKHDHKYSYEDFVYVNDSTKGFITCPIHGNFSQIPNNHLMGKGCVKCQYDRVSKLIIDRGSTASYSQWAKMGNESLHFDSFKVYVVVCNGHNESFIKVGKTYNTVDKRLKYIPYGFTIHDLIIGDDPIKICETEHNMKMDLKDYRYTTAKSFGGQFECFDISILHNGTINDLIKKYKN